MTAFSQFVWEQTKDYFDQRGIPTLPPVEFVDGGYEVLAFGCVTIKVKAATLAFQRGAMRFKFDFAPTELERGITADLVLLLCNRSPHGQRSLHLFSASDPVFYKDGRLKSCVTFTPGSIGGHRNMPGLVTMTQEMMDAAEDRIELIYEALRDKVAELKNEKSPKARN